MKKLALYAGAFGLVQGLTGCTEENVSADRAGSERVLNDTQAVPASAPQDDERLVLAFGDSLYAGYGLDPKESFPEQLEQALAAKGLAVDVRNAGVSGDTTAAAQRRLAFALDGLDRKPDLVMVNLGGNDMLRGIDPDETRRNLTAICEELKSRDIPIMLTGMIAAPNLGNDYADRFNPIYRDLAERYDATLYPFFLEGVITDSGLMLADRIHPNAKGIEAITRNVAPLVATALKAS
ncbi:arylesterase [Novosphingobium sp. M1R2S20]|uniref:Arylesterase n=1 Tax=Novosphingobium rhizovicinum TaxID=3228928 RepID=A0ABV3RH18_9SPHN